MLFSFCFIVNSDLIVMMLVGIMSNICRRQPKIGRDITRVMIVEWKELILLSKV